MAIGFTWILMVPNGWHSILKLNHNKRTDAQHSAGVGFDYSCFLNRLPDIQFLCSEHNKEKNISIFFLYASPPIPNGILSFQKFHHLLSVICCIRKSRRAENLHHLQIHRLCGLAAGS
jgi:hypothetical protein